MEKSFKQFIAEANKVLSPQELVDGIKSSFEKNFPNGWIKISYSNSGLSKGDIGINLGAIGNTSDLSGRIIHNDPMHHTFIIFGDGEDKWSAENSIAGIKINPPEGSHLAMSSVKTKWRKTTGTGQKVLKAYERFFTRLKKLLKDNESNIYQRDSYKDKYFK